MEKKKICKSCGEYYEYGNSFHKLCFKCNNLRLQKNKGVKSEPKQIKRNIIPSYKLIKKETEIVTNKIQGKKEIINPYNVSGESELFKVIWEERPHICVKCGISLGDEMIAHFFSHIYPKSIAPWRRLDPTNIELLCFKCHHEHDFGKRVTKL